MAIELYSLNPDTEDNYQDDIVDIQDELQIYLNEIRMILNGTAGTVLGAADMAIDLEAKIFEFDIDEKGLNQKILNVLGRYS